MEELQVLIFSEETYDLEEKSLDIWMPSRDDPLRVKFGFEGIEQIQICESVSFEPLDEIEVLDPSQRILHHF